MVLHKYLRLPARWFKRPPRQRLYYWVDGMVVCSPENYGRLVSGLDEVPPKQKGHQGLA